MLTRKEVIDAARRFLFRRRHNYVMTFNSQPGRIVLADLAKFCLAAESTFHDNERVAAKLDGRREVFLRIQHHLSMPPEELWALYDGREAE